MMHENYRTALQISTLALGLALAAGPAWSASVTITSDSRSISFEPNTFCQALCPTPTVVSGPIVNGTFNQQLGSDSPLELASQNSTVSADGLTMSGSGSALSWGSPTQFNNGGATSDFQISFTLNQAMDYTLTGIQASSARGRANFRPVQGTSATNKKLPKPKMTGQRVR